MRRLRWWRDRIAYLRLRYSLPVLAVGGIAALLLIAAATRLSFDFARSMERPTPAAFREVPLLRRSVEQVTVSAINTVTQFSSSRSEPILTVQLVIDPDQLSLFQSRDARRGRIVLPGNLWWNGEWINADVSLRGENVFHWGAELKSYKVRLKGRDTGGQDVFNLVNPKDKAGFDLVYGEETGRRLGLMSAGSVPCRVMLNGENQGLYACQQNINEAWVRSVGRIQGNLYSGDILYMGYDSNLMLAMQLWDRPDLWQQEMMVPGGDTQSDLRAFLSAVSATVSAPAGADPVPLYERLAAVADLDSFLRLWVAQTWSKSIHQDEFHNWRLFFDPSKGLLEPVVWDTLRDEGTSTADSLNAPLPRPQLAMLRFPELNQRRYEILYRELVAPELADHIAEKWAERFFERTRHTNLSASTLDQIDYVPDVVMWRTSSRLAVLKERRNTRRFIREHAAGLAAALRAIDVAAPVCLASGKAPRLECSFTLQSHAGVAVEGPVEGRTQFYPVMGIEDDRRAPGRVKARIVAAPQRFVLLGGMKDDGQVAVVFRNRVTGDRKTVRFTRVDALPAQTAAAGFSFAAMPTRSTEEIRLGPGTVLLRESLTTKPGQTLRIVAGTTLRMGRGASLIANGPLRVEGTGKSPVRIVPATAGEPWGGILVLGAAAHGTTLRHCDIAGGTTARHGNVTVAGMASFYHLDALTLENCRLSGDPGGADVLHAIHVPEVAMKDITVSGAVEDCIDLDYVGGVVEGVSTKGCGNDGLDVMASRVLVRRATLSDSGDKGVSIGENSMIMFEDVSIARNNIGLLAKDASVALLGAGVSFAANKLDISAYQKAKHAGHGGCIVAAGDEGLLNISLQDDSRFIGGAGSRGLADAWSKQQLDRRGPCWNR